MTRNISKDLPAPGAYLGTGIWSTSICILKAAGTDLPTQNGDISQKPYISAVRFRAAEPALKLPKGGGNEPPASSGYTSYPAELESNSGNVEPEPTHSTNEPCSVKSHTSAKYSGGFIT